MTKAEQDYQAANNVETENVKYAVANGLMAAEESGLSAEKLAERPLTIPEAIAVANPERDFASPEMVASAKATTGDDQDDQGEKITIKNQ